MKGITLSILLVLFSLPSLATVITHSSGSCEMSLGNTPVACGTSFDRATFSIAAEVVDTITLSNISGLHHDHGTSALLNFDIFSGGAWSTVFSYDAPSNTNVNLTSIFASPITFAAASITSFRLTTTSLVGYGFHNVGGGMTYTTSASSVPEPASLALLGLGLAGLGFTRRKQHKA